MNESQYLALLEKTKVLEYGHFVGKSRRHLDAYVNKAAITDPFVRFELSRAMAEKLQNYRIDTIVGPAVDGVRLADFVAYHLSLLTPSQVVQSLCAYKREKGGFRLKAGDHFLAQGQTVALVDDIATSGTTITEVEELVIAHGGQVKAKVVLWNRGNVPGIISLISKQLPSWEAQKCPMCQDKVLIRTDLGHGAVFLASIQKDKA
ncbi:orotate phosphoribosyltransferase [Patescibacteria group bacterium]